MEGCKAVDGYDYNRIIVWWGGFGQNDARVTGTERLQWRLLDEFHDGETLILFRNWWSSGKKMAPLIDRIATHNATLILGGYSKGGCQVRRCIWQLLKFGRMVQLAFAVDWVKYIGVEGDWSTIHLPQSSPRRFLGWRQDHSWPKGSKVVQGNGQELGMNKMHNTPHMQMDEDRIIQSTIIEEIRNA